MMFAAALTGSGVALWCVAAMGVVISTVKLVEWLCGVAGLTKSAEQKTLDVLEPYLVYIKEVHDILSDKVFAKEQEGRFDDIAYIKTALDRVLPWLKTPPEVTTPPFYCQNKDMVKELLRLGASLDQHLKSEAERDKQMELVIKLLQETLVKKGE